MATVVSLTESKIRELLTGWEGISLSQDEINALIAQLLQSQAEVEAMMENLDNVVMPQLQEDLAQNAIRVAELNDTAIPDLQNNLAQNDLALQNLNTVTIPSLEDSLQNEIDENAVRPKIYVQTEPPENPDENDRDLIIGDRWHDLDDNLKEHIWNGTDWVANVIEIPDLASMIEAYISPEHAIYKSPITGSVPVTIGSNITPV